MKHASFFDSPKSWSKRKHRLLGKYLLPFSAKTGSWAPLIYCVDGFAGKAKYGDNEPGSPLLMAHVANKCAAWQKPVHLRLINIESNGNNFDSLRYITQSWESKGIITNLHGEFGDLVPNVISQISEAPAFFFIDPFGSTAVKFSHLRPILERNQRTTELIINFDADGLRRIGDTLHSRTKTPTTLKTTQTNIANVTEIIGSDKWKGKFEVGNLTTKERERILLDEYMSNLSAYDYNVAAYAIRESKGKSPKYYLVFCTRHSAGIILMNSFIREEEDELLRDSTTKPDQPLLPSEEFDVILQEVQHRRKELSTLILDYLQKTNKTTRGQIRQHFIFNRFGEFHDKDYNAVMQELLNTAKVRSGHGRKRINDDEPLTYFP